MGGWRGFLRVTLVTVIAALAGCIDAGEVGGPSGPPRDQSPAAALVSTTVTYNLLYGLFPSPAGNGASCDVRGIEPGNKLQSAAWIDSRGGTLRISGGLLSGAHVLTVPANTVTRRTLFCMKLVPTNHMQVVLQARTLDAAGNVVDVGKKGFPQPVLLQMSYAPLQLTSAVLQGLVIVYDPENGGPYEPAPTTLQLLSLSVKAQIRHFSKYAMASSKYAMAVD